MPDFVVYLRVSTASQARSGLGMDAQRAAVARYLETRLGAVVLVTVEETESGKRSDRPELVRALQRCRLSGATLLTSALRIVEEGQLEQGTVVVAGRGRVEHGDQSIVHRRILLGAREHGGPDEDLPAGVPGSLAPGGGGAGPGVGFSLALLGLLELGFGGGDAIVDEGHGRAPERVGWVMAGSSTLIASNMREVGRGGLVFGSFTGLHDAGIADMPEADTLTVAARPACRASGRPLRRRSWPRPR